MDFVSLLYFFQFLSKDWLWSMIFGDAIKMGRIFEEKYFILVLVGFDFIE